MQCSISPQLLRSVYTKHSPPLYSLLIPGNPHSTSSSLTVAAADLSSKWNICIYMCRRRVEAGCLLPFCFVLLCDQIILLSTMSLGFIYVAEVFFQRKPSVSLTGHVLISRRVVRRHNQRDMLLTFSAHQDGTE